MSKNKETKDLAEAPKPADQALAAFNWEEHTDTGLEEFDSSELTVAHISILQDKSKPVKELEKAEPGMIYNNVSQQVWPNSMIFLPVKKTKLQIEWKKRSAGGGFVATHDFHDPRIQKARQKYIAKCKANGDKPKPGLPHGDNEIFETHYLYGLILDDAGKEPVGFGIISVKSSQITPVRKAMNAIVQLPKNPANNNPYPLWCYRLKLSTYLQQFTEGESWNYSIEPFGGESYLDSRMDPAKNQDHLKLFMEGKNFLELINSGAAKFDEAAVENEDTTSSGGGDDVPF
jgi:hypothetical protein